MRFIGLLLLMTINPLAFAQDAETAWVVDGLVSQRFPEGELQGPRFETDEEVQVIFKEGELVRIKGQAGFGWVSKDALTNEAPNDMSDVDIEALMERMKSLNLGGGGATSQPINLGAGQ